MTYDADTVVYRCEHAWLDDGVHSGVDISVDENGLISAVGAVDTAMAAPMVSMPGLVVPGFANAHSHAFHRALRGRTHQVRGTFWTWRERMYEVAAKLDPDSYFKLARATFAEMVLAGVTTVGEFHYLHHGPLGVRYNDPNAMGEALRAAASEAGLRLTLIDTCYLTGGLTADGAVGPDEVQQRFSDQDIERWASRFASNHDDANTRVGAAVHSVRVVPREHISAVVSAAAGRPLHVHVSEQPAENEVCLARYGSSPTALLEAEGVLTPTTTLIHATHLTDDDVERIGRAKPTVCFCPTTERDLADGIGRAGDLADLEAPLCLGSDGQAIIDLLEEARALEMNERLLTGCRGRFPPTALLAALTVAGHASLGWNDVGKLAVGQRADLVSIRLDSVRTRGAEPEQTLMASFATDVDTVVVEGRVVVRAGRHETLDVAAELELAIAPLWES